MRVAHIAIEQINKVGRFDLHYGNRAKPTVAILPVFSGANTMT